jgi:hypothetical protein
MTRFLYALALSLGLAVPASALSVDVPLPHLSFPDSVVTPSTKGCEPVQDSEACLPRG